MPEIKKDCFAYDRKKKSYSCKILTELVCEKGDCKFYKKAGTLCKSCNKQSYYNCVSCKEARKLL